MKTGIGLLLRLIALGLCILILVLGAQALDSVLVGPPPAAGRAPGPAAQRDSAQSVSPGTARASGAVSPVGAGSRLGRRTAPLAGRGMPVTVLEAGA
jgi:hypothetical protein